MIASLPPIIDTSQSVLGYRAYERWTFQPVAFGNVTSWYCTALPETLEFNPGTGKIEGFVSTPGVYSFILRAANEALISAPAKFSFGIDGAVDPNQIDNAILIDVESKLVGKAVIYNTSGTGWLSFLRPEAELLKLKHGDDTMLSVRLVSLNGIIPGYGGVASVSSVKKFDVATMKLALKDPDTETVVYASSDFALEVLGSDNIYRVSFRVTSPMIDALMAEQQSVMLDAEFQWETVNPSTVGPQLIRQSSEIFNVWLNNDIIE